MVDGTEDECKPTGAEMLIQSLSYLIEEENLNDLECRNVSF